jgi:hypothetical protein
MIHYRGLSLARRMAISGRVKRRAKGPSWQGGHGSPGDAMDVPLHNHEPMTSDAELHCPRCQAQMERGEIDLKAWGVGLLPQAQLLFDSEVLLKDQYVPLVGLLRRGTTAPAYRCRSCRIVCFHYGDR